MAWTPRPANERIENVIWLPRLIDKARRYVALGCTSRLFEGYCYGNNDFMDVKVFRFLRCSDETLTALVQEHADDATVARMLVERSGRTPEACAAFSERLGRSLSQLPLTDADEGILSPGFKRTAINLLYNAVILPIFYAQFRAAERKRG